MVFKKIHCAIFIYFNLGGLCIAVLVISILCYYQLLPISFDYYFYKEYSDYVNSNNINKSNCINAKTCIILKPRYKQKTLYINKIENYIELLQYTYKIILRYFPFLIYQNKININAHTQYVFR